MTNLLIEPETEQGATGPLTPPLPSALDRRISRAEWAALAAFVALAAIGLARHDLWRDELQVWAAALNANSIWEVVENRAYDGTPALWHLCVYPLTRLVDQPWAMQALHLLIASASAFVVLRWSPFPQWMRLAFIFGYYPFFEYCTISRNYALGMLLLLCFLACHPWRGWRAVAAGAALFLTAQTSAFGLWLAMAGAAAVVAQPFNPTDVHGTRHVRRDRLALLVAVALGTVVSVWHSLPPADSGVHTPWWTRDPVQALRAIAVCWQGLVPVPRPTLAFWGSNILNPGEDPQGARQVVPLVAQSLLTAVLVALAAWHLRRSRPALAFFLVGVLLCLAFFWAKKIGYVRHHGTVYLVLVGALWIAHHDAQQMAGYGAAWAKMPRPRLVRIPTLLAVLMWIHVAVGVGAWTMSLALPFSQACQAARWIEDRGLADHPMVGYRDGPASAVAMHLEREMYFPSWRASWRYLRYQWIVATPSFEEVLSLGRQRASELEHDVLLVLTERLPESRLGPAVQEVAIFPWAITDERFFLYRVSPAEP